MRKVIFREEQKFGSMSLYIIMGIIYAVPTIVFALAIYSQFVLNEPWGNKPMSDLGLLLTTFLVMCVLVVSAFLLFGAKLDVQITSYNIRLDFKPYIFKPISINKFEIDRFEIREYKALKEYGGWGMKQGKKGIGKAYSVSGNIGLQLYLTNGKKVLIGTQRRDAMLRAIKKMMENS